MALLGWGGSPKDKITYNKGTLTYPSNMIVAKPLLVVGRSHHNGVPHLLEHVDVRLELFLGSLLIIEGDDRLSLVDEEEGGVPHRVVHARLQALEHGGEFVHPSSGMNLELIIDAGFYPL